MDEIRKSNKAHTIDQNMIYDYVKEALLLVNSITMMLNSSLELDKVLNIAVQRVCEITGMACCSLFLLQDDLKTALLSAEYNIQPEITPCGETFINIENCPEIQKAINIRCPIIVEEVKAKSLTHESLFSHKFPAKSLAIFPLITKKKVIGILCLFSVDSSKNFTPYKIELSQTIANQIAVALANTQLLNDVQNQRDALKEANAKLKELGQLKQSLTTMIIHDLRTPLGGIIGYLGLLENIWHRHDDKCLKYLHLASKSSNELLHMINNLMDIAKMEADNNTLSKKLSKPNILVYKALSQVKGLIESNEQNLELNLDEKLPPLMVDEDKITRVLVNLLGNAIKFTPQDGIISIKSRLLNEFVEFQVCDTGEGIPREYLTRIFDKFEQVRARESGKKLSSGLGLTFCRLAVEAHGGRIWAESELGKSSKFIFQIPLEG